MNKKAVISDYFRELGRKKTPKKAKVSRNNFSKARAAFMNLLDDPEYREKWQRKMQAGRRRKLRAIKARQRREQKKAAKIFNNHEPK